MKSTPAHTQMESMVLQGNWKYFGDEIAPYRLDNWGFTVLLKTSDRKK